MTRLRSVLLVPGCGLRCRHRCRQFRSGTGPASPVIFLPWSGPSVIPVTTDLSDRLPPDLIRTVSTAAAHRSRKVLATTDLATGWWRFVRRPVLGGAHLTIISGLPTASAGGGRCPAAPPCQHPSAVKSNNG
jgi:hypothetical protein